MRRVAVLLTILTVFFVSHDLAGQIPSNADEKIQDFLYVNDEDDFSDEDRSLVITFDEDVEGAIGWKCLSDGLNIMLSLDGYMIGDDSDDIRVRYRFDEKEPSNYQDWGLFQGNETAYIKMHRVDQFTVTAKISRKLVMEAVDPADGETRRYHFSLMGLQEALEYLPCAQ